jgi:hypothetical protein
MRLLQYANNVYSQTGEDGILEKILGTLEATDKWCVEFGAWDGQYLSNTFNLVSNHGYSAVLIEADERRFQALRARFAHNEKIIPLNCYVGFSGENTLDAILARTPIPRDFDLLSVDIDGNDYHVWNALTSYRPKVVCVEYNPTIPNEVDFVQPADGAINQGSSLLAMTRLGEKKGYSLVAATRLNAIFVRSEDFHRFKIADNRPAALREDTSEVTYVFSGYDGTVFFTGYNKIRDSGLAYNRRLRAIPRVFRHYSPTLNRVTRVCFRAYCGVQRAIGRG